MIQINVSKPLAKDLKHLVGDHSNTLTHGMQWYAQKVTIDDELCVVVMEEESRYSMVFCGLSLNKLERFDEVFVDRLIKEVTLITQLNAPLSQDQLSMLTDIATAIGEKQYYLQKTNRSVQAHISIVVEFLERGIYNGHALPERLDEAIDFGIRMNDRPVRCHGSPYFQPNQVFVEFWLDLLNQLNAEQGNAHNSDYASNSGTLFNTTEGRATVSDQAPGQNIVYVDFRATKK